MLSSVRLTPKKKRWTFPLTLLALTLLPQAEFEHLAKRSGSRPRSLESFGGS